MRSGSSIASTQTAIALTTLRANTRTLSSCNAHGWKDSSANPYRPASPANIQAAPIL